MAIPWLTVLKLVPWSEVIGNAPKVADGAKKLWDAVARKPVPSESEAMTAKPASTHPPRGIGELEARIAALESITSDLHNQMLASSELIKTLAEQNAQLIQRIETNRARTVWLGVATGILALITLAALIMG